MFFVDVDGTLIHARLETPAMGAAVALPLFHLHSLGTELRIWDGVVARLPQHTQLRMDLRGHGLSDAPPGDYSIARMVGDAIAVMDRAEIDRAVWVGVSVGGQVALRAALERRRRVAGVVALDTAARIGDRDGWEERIRAVRHGGIGAIADAVVARWFGPGFSERDPHTPRGLRSMLLRTSPVGYAGTCAALRDEDLTDHLHRITPPVLVVCGRHDSATPPELGRALAGGLRHGRYVEIAEAAHLPCVDRPASVAALVDDFVRGLSPPTRD